MALEATNSLGRTASWVIVRLADNAPLFETYNPKVIAHLNAAKYKAVPILEYLQDFNRRIRIGETS